MNTRIIPRLDIKGPNLVKGIHLEGLRVLGKPDRFARYYYESGADELIYMDVVASLYGRNSLAPDHRADLPRDLHSSDRRRGFANRRRHPRRAARRRGQGVDQHGRDRTPRADHRGVEAVRFVDDRGVDRGREALDGSYEAYTDYGRVRTGIEVFGWAKKVEELGCGEILLTSIDAEGTGRGYDLELVRQVSTSVSIPVIASGGAGRDRASGGSRPRRESRCGQPRVLPPLPVHPPVLHR